MAKLNSGTRIYGSATIDTTLSLGTSAIFSGSTSGTTTLLATAAAGTTTLTLPATTSTLATLTGTETFTNKTLTSPVIGTIVNTGTLTLPTSTDTLVGKATTDTLTNKTLSAAVLTGTLTAGGGVGTNGQVLQSTVTGVQWATVSGGASATITISDKTAAYTVIAGDLGTVINCTSGTFTVSLDAAATLGSGFSVTIWNTGTGIITLDPNASESIDGLATRVLYKGEGAQLVCTGTNWLFGNSRRYRGFAQNVGSGEIAATATGDGATAWGVNVNANGTNSIAGGYLAIAGSNFSTALGNNSGGNGSQTATGAGAMALGGSYASGIDSFAAGGANNTGTYGATSANCIAIGQQSKASSGGSVALASYANASGYGSFAVGGSAVASGTYAVALGNQAAATAAGSFAVGSVTHLSPPTASASNSFAFGAGAYVNHTGKLVISGGDLIAATTYQNGLQAGTQVLRGQTIDATAKVLVSNTDLTAAGTDNQVILRNNSAFAFSGIIVARRQAAGGTASAAWQVEGLIRREGNAASTVLVASAINTISNVPGWTLALTADTTNGALAITATGAASTNIRWVATIQTSEVTYA